MNYIIRKILILLIYLFWVPSAFAASKEQIIEVKDFGQDVFFIFYRDKNQNVDIKYRNGRVLANFNHNASYKLKNPDKFNIYARDIVFQDNSSIAFTVSDDLIYQSVINGERFDTIKFKSQKNSKEDLSLIGSAANNTINNTIKYVENKGDHSLLFNLGINSGNKAAIFQRGDHLWVVFDKKNKELSFKEQAIVESFENIDSETGTVLRFKVKNLVKYSVYLDSIKSGWKIILSSKKNKPKYNQDIIKINSSEDQDRIELLGDFSNHEIVSFEDPEMGHRIIAIPVINPQIRVLDNLSTPEYDIFSTITGVAIAVISEDITVNKRSDKLEILSNIALQDNLTIENTNFPGENEAYLQLKTLIPYLDQNLNILDFNTQKSLLMSEAAMAVEKEDILAKNLALAQFFFIHGWYQESLETLLVIKHICKEEYKESLESRFLTAVNFTILEESHQAKLEYEDLLQYSDVKEHPEISMWYKYNEFSLGTNPGKIGFLSNINKSLKFYADDSYWSLVFAEIELALIANEVKHLDKIFKEVRKTSNPKYANSLKFYKAELYRKKNQLNLAKQLYKEVMREKGDDFNSVRAEFDLIKLQVKEKEIPIEEAMKALEKLRFLWRGDQLEYEILIQLAAYYRQNNDIMNALRIYKYTQDAFDNKISNFYITSEMAKIFKDVFLTGGIGEKMDDFTVVALFYEFKELNPIGENGDEVILAMAKRLVKLDLLENAADLLKHQITYRLQGEKRVKNADTLAIILMIDKKPLEAIAILNDTDNDNINFKEHQYRVRLRAKALIDLGKYDKALDYLRDDDTSDADILKKEAMFQGKKWSNYIDLVNNNLYQTIDHLSSNTAAVQDILRLAIAYHILNLPESLQQLAVDIESKHPALKNIIDLLVTSSKPLDYKHLDQSLNIDQMKIMLDKYQKQLLEK